MLLQGKVLLNEVEETVTVYRQEKTAFSDPRSPWHGYYCDVKERYDVSVVKELVDVGFLKTILYLVLIEASGSFHSVLCRGGSVFYQVYKGEATFAYAFDDTHLPSLTFSFYITESVYLPPT